MDAVTAGLLGAIFGGIGGALVNAVFGRGKSKAETENITANTIATLNLQISTVIAEREGDRKKIDSLEERIDEMEEAAEVKDKYIKKLEEENQELLKLYKDTKMQLNRIKAYVKGLLEDLRKQQVNFTEPADGLLDTQELAKKEGE